MNKRIRELAEEAGFQFILYPGIGWAGNHNASIPKFAELIIAECLYLCESTAACQDAEAIQQAIQQHFEVEQ